MLGIDWETKFDIIVLTEIGARNLSTVDCLSYNSNSRVFRQKGPTRHAYVRQIVSF